MGRYDAGRWRGVGGKAPCAEVGRVVMDYREEAAALKFKRKQSGEQEEEELYFLWK